MSVPRQTRTSAGGFTLLELMVALLLFSILLSALYGFLESGLAMGRRAQDKAEVEENLRIGMNRLTRELREADSIVSFTPGFGGRLTFYIQPDPDNSSLKNKIGYHCSISGDNERAYQLIRSVNGAGNNPVARYINTISVEPANCGPDTRLLTITLTGEKGLSGKVTLTSTVLLRKKN